MSVNVRDSTLYNSELPNVQTSAENVNISSERVI